jgi:hypothetical protein
MLAVGAATTNPPASEPTAQQVQLAVDQLRADPNLPGSKTTKSLRLRAFDESRKEAEKPDANANLAWFFSLIAAITEGTRLLVWALGVVMVALLAVGARRWMKVRADGARHHVGPLTSHVGSLDIRPASLPARIGAAASTMWRQGKQRAALSLLYRGVLSRAVHLHGVPIRAASTEGEALALAAAHLAPEALALFGRLVAAWQLAAYGGRLPETAVVLELCTDFDAQFDEPAETSTGPLRATEAASA